MYFCIHLSVRSLTLRKALEMCLVQITREVRIISFYHPIQDYGSLSGIKYVQANTN